MIKRPGVAILVGMAVLPLAACLSGGPGTAPGDPADPNAQMRPDLIVAEPKRVAAGAVLELTFPEETVRGVLFVLESQARGTWFHQFNLVSDGPGPDWRLDWSPAGDEEFAVPAIGVAGPGPDRVPIPDVAEPGTWRICTGNAGQNICAPIEIVEP
jgi:hypothetical protein